MFTSNVPLISTFSSSPNSYPPELLIPVSLAGGYGTESHGHLVGQVHRHEPTAPPEEQQAIPEAAPKAA